MAGSSSATIHGDLGLWLGRKLIEGEERAGVLPIEAGGSFYRSSRGSTLMAAGRSLSGWRWRPSSASMELLSTSLDSLLPYAPLIDEWG